VIFYGQIADERRLFNVESIIHRLVEKLIRRHPHVFPEGTLHSERDPGISPQEAEINANWDAIKQQEKQGKPEAEKGLLADIPANMPALTHAVKIQKKVSKVGFDWDNIQGVLDKVREELAEVEAEIEGADPQRLHHEIGDLMFAVSNLARHLKVDPEAALRTTNQRFKQRFAFVERSIESQGGWTTATLEQMEAAWTVAKKQEA